MIAIENTLISDEVISAQFVCDLNKCKGGCCEDGDAGAPLTTDELKEIRENFHIIKPYLSAEGIEAIESQGKYVHDASFGWVTPTIDGGICAYGQKDEKGIIRCGIEQAFLDGKIKWKKPISCHLFPIRISPSMHDPSLDFINYEPRQDLCRAACALGKSLKIPVYIFLKEALIRKYGVAFYETLEATVDYMQNGKNAS